MSNWKQVANDRRIVRCFQIRDRKKATTDVPDYQLVKDIDAGWRYFCGNRPSGHWFQSNMFEFNGARRNPAKDSLARITTEMGATA